MLNNSSIGLELHNCSYSATKPALPYLCCDCVLLGYCFWFVFEKSWVQRRPVPFHLLCIFMYTYPLWSLKSWFISLQLYSEVYHIMPINRQSANCAASSSVILIRYPSILHLPTYKPNTNMNLYQTAISQILRHIHELVKTQWPIVGERSHHHFLPSLHWSAI